MTDRWAALAHQALRRELSASEQRLAEALEAIYADGVSDFTEVIRRLSEQGVEAPMSGTRQWDEALLERELESINASLDEAYARKGIGA